MVSLILPKNEWKQFDLRYHSISKVKFFCLFLGEFKIPKRNFKINWPKGWKWHEINALPEIWSLKRTLTKALGSGSWEKDFTCLDLHSSSHGMFCQQINVCQFFLPTLALTATHTILPIPLASNKHTQPKSSYISLGVSYLY